MGDDAKGPVTATGSGAGLTSGLNAPPSDGDEPVLISESMLDHGDSAQDFERGMGYAPPVTIAVIVALVGVFGWQLARHGLASEAAIVASGALERAHVLAGEWWRTLSATALHGSADHLVGNCISLYILGMACEHALGGRRMLLVYGASALAGSAVSLAVGPGPSVGASGAIFGLMGAIVVFLHRERATFRVRDGRIGYVVGAWAAYTFFLGAVSPMVDNGAHLGGLVGGALAVLAVRPRLARVLP